MKKIVFLSMVLLSLAVLMHEPTERHEQFARR